MAPSTIVKIVIIALVAGFFAWRYFYKKGTQRPDPDEQVLNQLRQAGSNLVKIHKLDFFLYFQTQEIAEMVKVELMKLGFVAEVSHSAKGSDWLCQATKEMLPIHSQVTFIRNQLSEIAKRHNGIYDGWGTGIIK